MRVLFAPFRDAQHLYPMVPLAWACRTAGHEVRVSATPRLSEAAVHTGLPVVAAGRDVPTRTRVNSRTIDMVYRHRRFPADWPLHPELLDADQRAAVDLLGRNAAVAAERVVDDLIDFARYWRPDLIVHDTANFAGAVAAAAIGVPDVRHLTGVGLRPMERLVGHAEPRPEYVDLFERRAIPVRAVPTMTIDPSPPSLRLPVPDPYLESRFVPYNGPGTVPSWLLPAAAGRPLVCVTWGLSVSWTATVLGAAALEPLRLTISALSDLDIEVVVAATASQLELLGELPATVRQVTGLPLHLLLPHSALIVHQAGDGTVLTAAACGVPQLAVTRKPDPALTGDRLAAAGVAIHLRYQDLEADGNARETVRTAAARLIGDPSYAAAAAALRTEIEGQPTPAALVAGLESLEVLVS